MNLEIEFTDELPTHTLYITTSNDEIRVRCSPRVEAEALLALRSEIADAIADAVDGRL